MKIDELNNELYAKFIPKSANKLSDNKQHIALDSIQTLFDFLVKCDYSALTIDNNFIPRAVKNLTEHLKEKKYLIPALENNTKSIYFLKRLGHLALDDNISSFISDKVITRDPGTDKEFQEEMKDYDYFKYSVEKILNKFPNSSIILNGSFKQKGQRANDVDFKVIVPNLNQQKYLENLNYAFELRKEKPKITFMMIPEEHYKTFAAAENNTHFIEGDVINKGYTFNQIPNNIKMHLELVNAIRKKFDLENYLNSEETLSSNRLNARARDPFYILQKLEKVFGKKEEVIEININKYQNEEIKNKTQQQILKEKNEQTNNLIQIYSKELTTYLLD